MVDNVSNYMMVYLLYYKAMNFLRCDFTAICRNLDGRAIEKKKSSPAQNDDVAYHWHRAPRSFPDKMVSFFFSTLFFFGS